MNRTSSSGHKLLLGVISICLLYVSLLACGQGSVSGISPNEIISSTDIQRQATHNPPAVILSPGTLIDVQTLPLQVERYSVAWRDPELGYVAQSKPGIPIPLPNGVGDSLEISLFNSLGFELIRKRQSQPHSFAYLIENSVDGISRQSDESCESCCLTLEELILPELTTGDPELFEIRVGIYEETDLGRFLIEDELGNRPIVTISLQAENGSLEESMGQTDPMGYFRTFATLAEEQDFMTITAIVELQSDADSEPIILESQPIRMDRLISEVFVDFETPPPPVTLPLTPGGDPITLTVFVTTPEDAASVDSDIVLLQDLSGSFGDDLSVLQTIAPAVVSAFPQACFGVSSFVDKPIEPFGDPDSGDYVYRTDLPVSCDANGFISTINGLQIFSGGDIP